MHLGETLLPWKSKSKKCCLYETPYVAAPIWVLGDIIAKFSALRATSYRQTYKSQFVFLVHEWCISEETFLVISRLLRQIFTRGSMSKSGTVKDYLSRLRSSAKSTFKWPSANRLSSDTSSWAKASGTLKIKMTTRKGHWAISPKSHASHPLRF